MLPFCAELFEEGESFCFKEFGELWVCLELGMDLDEDLGLMGTKMEMYGNRIIEKGTLIARDFCCLARYAGRYFTLGRGFLAKAVCFFADETPRPDTLSETQDPLVYIKLETNHYPNMKLLGNFYKHH